MADPSSKPEGASVNHLSVDFGDLGLDPEDAARPSQPLRLVLPGEDEDGEGGAEEQAPALVPASHPDLPLFDVRVMMERPFFALATKPRHTPIVYTSPDGRLHLRAEPRTERALATIHDGDILIYLVSALVRCYPQGEVFDQTVAVRPAEVLRMLGRGQGGRQYTLLQDALARLSGTEIRTNIAPDGRLGQEATFRLLEAVDGADDDGLLRLVMPAWLATAVRERHLLKVNPSYFDLSGGLERWLYRVARKHAGVQAPGWKASVRTLWHKAGAGSPHPRFKHALRVFVERDPLPDYSLWWIDEPGRKEPGVGMVLRNMTTQHMNDVVGASLFSRHLRNADRHPRNDRVTLE